LATTVFGFVTIFVFPHSGSSIFCLGLVFQLPFGPDKSKIPPKPFRYDFPHP
jgi:hypothetical protein